MEPHRSGDCSPNEAKNAFDASVGAVVPCVTAGRAGKADVETCHPDRRPHRHHPSTQMRVNAMTTRLRSLLVALLMLGVATIGPPAAWAQQQGQQQGQQTQRQMQDMQQMQAHMQRMTQLMQRTHTMSQQMQQRMQDAQNEQQRQQMQQMQRLGEHFHAMAGEMKNAMERNQAMMQNKEMMRNREMERDMSQLRNHMNELTEEMENTVRLMERMTNRMQTRVSMREEGDEG